MKKILFILMVMLFAAEGFAQNGNSDIYKKIVVNNHVFPTVVGMKSAFVVTSFMTNLSVGQTSVVTIPSFEFDSVTTRPVHGSILFADFFINYEQRFRPWLSLYMTYGIAGRYGTDVFALLYDGINTINGGDIGWHLRVLNKKKWLLSTHIYVKQLSGSFISLSDFIDDLINDNPNPSVIKHIPSIGFGNSWEMAYAFNQTWGIQGSLNLMYGESFVRGKNALIYSLDVAGDADLYPKFNVPLGFVLGYNLAGNPEVMMNKEGHTHLYFFKLNYTGSPDFELGLQSSLYSFRVSSYNNKTLVFKTTFNLRFYF